MSGGSRGIVGRIWELMTGLVTTSSDIKTNTDKFTFLGDELKVTSTGGGDLTPVIDELIELNSKVALDDTLDLVATEATQELIRQLLILLNTKDYATETTQAGIKTKTDLLTFVGDELKVVASGGGGTVVPPNLDAFDRLRVSQPQSLFDAQLTYGLQPLVWEQITSGTGATVTHDATNRNALMTFASTGAGGVATMQTYEHFRYQAGKSQQIFISFNIVESVAGVRKFAGYSDGINGIEFNTINGVSSLRLLSGTSSGNETVLQTNWNLNTFSGLDLSKTQLMLIDFQALYVGIVRVGFEIGNQLVYVHQFNHANSFNFPYIQSANLPIRVGMERESGTVTTTMRSICASVSSEGGLEVPFGVPMSVGTDSKTASNNNRTHFLSIRPKTTFNGFTNRAKIVNIRVSIIVTGNNPIKWELCIGQAITGASYQDVNNTYSSIEYSTAGTDSGLPALVLDSGIVATGKNIDTSFVQSIDVKVPITLNAAGAVRSNGTLSLVLTGVDGNSDAYTYLKWIEIY